MNDDISKGVWLVANIVIGKLIASIASKLRKPELYLAIDYSMKDLKNRKKYNTAILYIINKGKNIEKNIEIHLPQSKFVKILSSEGVQAGIDSNIIKINRLLSKEHISLTVSYFGDILSKNNQPHILSDGATGKSYFGTKNIPLGRGPTVFSITVALIICTLFLSSIFLKVNPLIYVTEKYNAYRYSNFLASEFSTPLLIAEKDLKFYDIKNNEFPIKVIEIKKDNNVISITFEALNKYNLPAKVYASFAIKNVKEFNTKFEALKDIYVVDGDYKKFRNSAKDLVAEYKIPTPYSSNEITLKPGQKGTVSLSREITTTINENDLDMNIFFNTSDGDIHLFAFDFSKSKYYLSNQNTLHIKDTTLNAK